MNMEEKMLNGLPYIANDEELRKKHDYAQKKTFEFNRSLPHDKVFRKNIIKTLFKETGEKFNITPPFNCDYGCNITIGENFYSNFNLVILDVAEVIIGDNVMFGPNVGIYTAGHPIHPEMRNDGYEYGIKVEIGSSVWFGGNVVVNPGIRIGDNVVVGSGSVITKDIPDNVIVAGNPAKILREITEEDKKYYFRNREFNIDMI